MFGFITPNKTELSEEERARYEAVYCGMCHVLGQRCGQVSRMALNNDMTFVALLLGSLYEPVETRRVQGCPAHPFKKREWVQHEYIDYAADITLALAYFKCLDDWQDDKRAAAAAGARMLKRQYERVRERRARQCAALESGMRAIAAAEREQMQIVSEARAASATPTTPAAPSANTCSPDSVSSVSAAPTTPAVNPDVVANIFGNVMAELLVVRGDFWAGALSTFGAHFGRFIYMMDAAFDIERDKKRGSYNPFLLSGFSQETIYEVLLMYAANMAREFEKIPCVQDVNILRNVLYSGVWVKYQAKFQKDAESAAGSRSAHGAEGGAVQGEGVAGEEAGGCAPENTKNGS